MNKIKEETMPDDIILDLARTVEILADSHNCDDGSLKLRGLDWAYLHKLNRRSKHWLNKVYNLDESEGVCVACDGKGYLTDVYDTEAEETQIQRCDSCKEFVSDKQAREHIESEAK